VNYSTIAGLLALLSMSAVAQNQHVGFQTPNSVEGTLAETAKQQSEGLVEGIAAKKQQLQEKTGLAIGVDNITQYLGTDSDKKPSDAASNVFRTYGTWSLVGRNTPNDGALIFKIENRSAIGGHISTQALGPSLGYAGFFSSAYSDAGWILSNFYWRQHFMDGRGSFVIGQVDVTDYVDVNSLASPWTAFSNLLFEQQPTLAAPSQGLGAALLWRFDDHWAVLGGFADANGDPSDPGKKAEEFFERAETFKHIAVGWSPVWSKRTDQMIQMTFWQQDERKEAGIEDGTGVSLTASSQIDEWKPFFRAGYADGAGTALDRAVSGGFGYDIRGGKDLAGLAAGWGRAPGNSRDQFTIEGFYRIGLTDFLQLSPEIQYIVNPANDSTVDDIFVFGARLRVFL